MVDQIPDQPTITNDGSQRGDEPTAIDLGIRGYRILRQLGLGGMGIVFLAEQEEPVRRQVALKLILHGVSNRVVLARFEQERQALALMNHPNIAQVYDAGITTNGQPFFVMEYIEGVPITQHCDDLVLSIRERLHLFRQMCAGVQHAHQRGIIHRDLKPTNALVSITDGAAIVKIIDFGVARTLDRQGATESLQTQFGQLIGTPAYMSPEQAELGAAEVDTRTDVYALGVILFQLMTGRLPFELAASRTTDLVDLLHRIKQDDAPRPSAALATNRPRTAAAAERRATDARSLVSALRGDLDWIVSCAMERDLGRRYPGASELSADIERHLGDQAVMASPPSRAYRASKFVRRHRLGVIASALIALALLVAVGVSTVGVVKARRAETAARAEAAKTTAIYEFLLRILGSPNPAQQGREVRVVDALAKAEAASAASFAGQPQIEAGVRGLLANTYFGLGVYDRAVEERQKQADLLARTHGENDRETLNALASLSEVLYLRGPLQETEPVVRAALERTSRALGEDDPITLSQKTTLATVLGARRDFAAAEPLARSVVDTLRRRSETRSTSFMTALSNLAAILQHEGHLEEAEKLHREVLAASTEASGPEAPGTLNVRNSLATVLGDAGKFDQAGPLIAENLALQQRVLGPDHPDTLLTLSNLATIKFVTQHVEEAEHLFREALERAERSLPPGHANTELYRSSTGQCLTALGRCREAIPLLAMAQERLSSAQGIHHPFTQDATRGLVEALDACGQHQQAERFRKLIDAPAEPPPR